MKRLLLLAGTEEARLIAGALSRDVGIRVIASLAGATRRPRALGVPTRIGGFGGEAGFRAYLADQRIDAVLDATHPFAARISHRAFDVSSDLGLPYVMFLRPPWLPQPDENWVFLNTEAEAAQHIPSGARVFMAVGRQNAQAWGRLEGRTVFARAMETPQSAFPFETGRFIVGQPAASVEDELGLLETLGVDWLVAKNSGGRVGRAKLDAARTLGMSVAMLRRPLQPQAPKVSSVSAAINWARQQV